jgi:hypothetical protein
VAFSGGEGRDETGPEKSTGFPFLHHSEHCKNLFFCRDYIGSASFPPWEMLNKTAGFSDCT